MYPNNEVVGNNVKYSIWGKISGAMVAKEGLCIAVSKKVHGKDTTIYINCIDSDASSQYPSLSEILNIAKSTVEQHGGRMSRNQLRKPALRGRNQRLAGETERRTVHHQAGRLNAALVQRLHKRKIFETIGTEIQMTKANEGE